MQNNKHPFSIRFFVSADDPNGDEVAEALLKWGEKRADCTVEVVPVLSQPEEVVRLQIFYTPALVIGGQLIAGGIKSSEDLRYLLPE